jgi:hypothetical protein
MNKTISRYMAEIGRKGGKVGKRTWSEEQKAGMVAKKAETLRKKKELRGEDDTIAK